MKYKTYILENFIENSADKILLNILNKIEKGTMTISLNGHEDATIFNDTISCHAYIDYSVYPQTRISHRVLDCTRSSDNRLLYRIYTDNFVEPPVGDPHPEVMNKFWNTIFNGKNYKVVNNLL